MEDHVPDGFESFLSRVRMASSQRRYGAEAPHNPNPGYAIVHPNHASTLLLRDIDDMNEEDVLTIFLPNFKEEIAGIRLFPPIPGTRGFAFIDFHDAIAAIRAFTLKQRATIMYRGNPKKIHLSRVTKGTTTDTETKWMKYQERSRRNDGKPDSTPRRMTVNPGTAAFKPGTNDQVFNEAVTTVPFSAISSAMGESKESGGVTFRPTQRSPPREEGGASLSRTESVKDRASERRDRLSTARRDSPDRRRSPPRDSGAARRDRPGDRRPPDSREADRRRESRDRDYRRRDDERRRDDDRRRDEERRRDDERRREDDRRKDSSKDSGKDSSKDSSKDSNPFRQDDRDADRTRSRDSRDDSSDDRKRQRTDDRLPVFR